MQFHKPFSVLKTLLFALCLVLLSAPLTAQGLSLEEQLSLLPDVIFTKIETPRGYEAAYELKIRQPLDHKNPDKGHFYQRVFLSHRAFDRPTVLVTEGYARGRNQAYELTELVNGNQIDVEHRYYGASVPEEMDYQFLRLEQAAADMHKINELFRQIYTGKWLATGISKGGQTTIIYRYFYPEDVDVSVPYVAPVNLALEDKRVYEFLESVGTKECRGKIIQFQQRMLRDREKVLPLLKWYAKGGRLTFDYLTMEEAYEYGVLEYSFSFWQWGADCASIPAEDAPLEEALEHFIDVSGISFFSDRDMKSFGSHYYQAAAEMGYYGYDTKAFKGMLKYLPESPNPSAIFPPDKMKVAYDNSTLLKVDAFVKKEAHHFIYIYGAIDTWSATAVQPNDRPDCLWFFLEGKDHGGARIRNLGEEDRAKLEGALEDWLGESVRGTIR